MADKAVRVKKITKKSRWERLKKWAEEAGNYGATTIIQKSIDERHNGKKKK